jgi:hypothetical protein
VSALLAAFMLASQPAAPLPEHVLRFHYYRMVVFQQRARELHCGAADLDRALEKIRRRLNKRYGKNAFTAMDHSPGGPGDCGVILMVYRRNLEEFRMQADAALNAPAPAAPAAPGS